MCVYRSDAEIAGVLECEMNFCRACCPLIKIVLLDARAASGDTVCSAHHLADANAKRFEGLLLVSYTNVGALCEAPAQGRHIVLNYRLWHDFYAQRFLLKGGNMFLFYVEFSYCALR